MDLDMEYLNEFGKRNQKNRNRLNPLNNNIGGKNIQLFKLVLKSEIILSS